MQLTVNRKWYSANSTIGTMSVDDQHFCNTLEPRADRSEGKPYCIPAGSYSVQILFSPRFQMNTPHVMNVPGFEEIEIHPGNFPKDTEGCCLAGTTVSQDFVGNSRAAFHALMQRLQGNSVTITYVDGQ